jgi:hypothetical protein
MRLASLIAFACIFGCAGRQTAWTTLDPPNLPDGGEAFVLIGNNALHLANVEQVDGHLHGRVVRAWLLPRAGAVAIADDTSTTSPEEVARRAGWQELHVARAQLDVPISAIRSARGVLDVEPDEDTSAANDSDHQLLIAVMTTALDIVLMSVGDR